MYRQDMPDTEELVLAFAKRNLRRITQVTTLKSERPCRCQLEKSPQTLKNPAVVKLGVEKLGVGKLGVGEDARAKALGSSQGGSGG
jgi:hypothetical protein